MRMGVVTSPADVTLKVNYLFQHGADSIKLIATGAVFAIGTDAGQQELSEDEMRAAVDVARARGSWVTAHAHGAAGIKAAIRAGVRGIEHASLIDDEGIAMAKARGVYLDMDVYNGDWTDEIGKRDTIPKTICARTRRPRWRSARAFRKRCAPGSNWPSAPTPGSIPTG